MARVGEKYQQKYFLCCRRTCTHWLPSCHYTDDTNVCWYDSNSLSHAFNLPLIIHFFHFVYQLAAHSIDYRFSASLHCSSFAECLFIVLVYLESWNRSVYDAYVNVPFGVAHYAGKLFVAMPRRNPGIPATLSVVELIGERPHINPLLMGYPSYEANSLSVNIRRGNSQITADNTSELILFSANEPTGPEENRFGL